MSEAKEGWAPARAAQEADGVFHRAVVHPGAPAGRESINRLKPGHAGKWQPTVATTEEYISYA